MSNGKPNVRSFRVDFIIFFFSCKNLSHESAYFSISHLSMFKDPVLYSTNFYSLSLTLLQCSLVICMSAEAGKNRSPVTGIALMKIYFFNFSENCKFSELLKHHGWGSYNFNHPCFCNSWWVYVIFCLLHTWHN